MEQKAKDYILNTLNVGRDYSENGEAEYSGRGMSGKTTHAIVVEYSSDVEDAVREALENDEDSFEEMLEVELIKEAWDDDADFEFNNGGYDLQVRRDSLGSNYIIY